MSVSRYLTYVKNESQSEFVVVLIKFSFCSVFDYFHRSTCYYISLFFFFDCSVLLLFKICQLDIGRRLSVYQTVACHP